MNYTTLFTNLKTELKDFCQYKQLPILFRIFAVIATLPFWISFVLLIVAQYIYLFFLNGFAASSDYLEKWLTEIRKGVNTYTTEAVIYLTCLPTIFVLKCFLSIFSVIFYFGWFFTMCSGYIASLGGIKWQPFISNAKFDKNEKLTPTTNITAGKIIVLIGAILFVISFTLTIIFNNGSINEAIYEATEDIDVLLTIHRLVLIVEAIYELFVIIAVSITFRKKITTCENNETNQISEIDSEQNIPTTINDIDTDFPEI